MSVESTEAPDVDTGGGKAGGPDAPSGGAEPADDGPEQLPLDVIFDILKNRRRRLVLRYARENEEPFTLSDLAEYIAADENDKPVQQLTSDERKRVYVGLYQCHLPRMDDAGVLDFDRNRGTISMNGSVSQLEPYLSSESDESGRRWPLYYGGLTIAGFLLYGAALIPVVPISLSVATLLALVAFAGCSLAHVALKE